MSIPDGYVPAPYPKHCYAKNPSDGSVITKVFASPEDHQFELDLGVKWFESPGEALRGKSDPVKAVVDAEQAAQLQATIDALNDKLAAAEEAATKPVTQAAQPATQSSKKA